MLDTGKELNKAVKHFWLSRAAQSKRQGVTSGARDTGNRKAVTGGKHADGFVNLIAAIVREAGLPDASIRFSTKAGRTLPGFFRPAKEWDVLVISGADLVAAVEVKSQVGSFGNNFNNRVEEALGNATDFWATYAQGGFAPSSRPWLGYLFMLEDSEASRRATRRVALSPYPVDGVFQGLSYVDRYAEVCRRLVRERMYDAACLFTSNALDGAQGIYREPNPELGIRNFAVSLGARVSAFVNMK
ncbi:MAG: PaeR7I family type II restriction endonuclease [Pseudomonadota bacterium]